MKSIKKILCTLIIPIVFLCGCETPNYTTQDVEITGDVIKQYTELVRGRYSNIYWYYSVIDYGGENLKIINDKDFFHRHEVGDKVKLIKHRTYINGEWLKTEVRLK